MLIVALPLHALAASFLWQPGEAFSLFPSAATTSSSLSMGGYYADPEVPLDQSNTHMVFGQRCLETKVAVTEETTLVWLQPTNTNDDDAGQVEVDHGPLLVQHLLHSLSFNNNNQGCSVLEIGASSFSLAALLALDASFVVVCHPQEQRLRIVDHTRQFLNPELQQQSSKGSFQTEVLQPGIPLPKADVIVFTTTAWDRLEEAVSSDPMVVLVPLSIISQDQLQNYEYEETNGVVQIIAVKKNV
ncbi:expressed unknown protein [Seminavis robusta]|uniref:Uncharacterized protein n=1 Tax=Seminavis robusta TaxID=568900 RepID=A0A9N8E8N4_9STRA|nr:expressed unknown protein [Seminavis robusta]|eukprot:Sro806_g205110.1 n/a (244) ;mRNA; f:20892-21763